jgi:ABC-type Na+ efflux pump permease subunit
MFSRGMIYVTIGVVLVVAGWVGNAQNVVGFGGAMRTVSDNAFGIASLAIIAAGLVAYGLFMFIEARYRRIGDSVPSSV